jgi:hypothetical protein
MTAMNIITRREFLGTAAAATSSTLIAATKRLHTGGLVGVPDEGSDAVIGSPIFPKPQHITFTNESFAIDERVRILVPSRASEQDSFLARRLAHELSDRFDRHLRITPGASVQRDSPSIVMGSIENPLVRQYCDRLNLHPRELIQAEEGYLLHVDKNLLLIAGRDDRGAFYGFQSLRQLLRRGSNQVDVPGVDVRDWPDKPFRGIYLYLPGTRNFAFFRRFVRDFMALYKYNTLIMEMGASMRLDAHPELNAGWREFVRDCNYSGRNYPPGPFHEVEQNSSHQDTADGEILEKDDVASLAHCVAENHIELIPEIASFTHSYYLLTRYRTFAAVPEHKWPDIYCAAHDDVYPLVFDVYDEYLDLLRPKMVHIGHDELFLPIDISAQCMDTDIGEIYGQDVKKVHDHLATRGVKTALWGDMLLESVRGRGPQKHKAADGFSYQTPGGMTREQVDKLIPKDCLVFNWFWQEDPTVPYGNAKLNEDTLDKMGFKQVYGNFDYAVTDYNVRKQRSSLLGGAPSAWFATNESGFGKELIATFLGCSSILWNGDVPSAGDLSARVQSLVPFIRERLGGFTPPSQTEASILPIEIAAHANFDDNTRVPGVDLKGMKTGTVKSGSMVFDLKITDGRHTIIVGTQGKEPSSLPRTVSGIKIDLSPTSLIFLHAAARPASNKESFRVIWDQQDTADLLGWYEAVYEDGYITSIPVRYGVHLLEWDCHQRSLDPKNTTAKYCYGADAVALGTNDHPITFFAYEWPNPRVGKVIRELRVWGTSGFRGGSSDFDNSWGPVTETNAIMLRALSYVQKRS